MSRFKELEQENAPLKSVVATPALDNSILEEGVPEHARRDNGVEFTSGVVREWLGKVGVKTLYTEPGSPLGNSDVETLNEKLLDELPNGEIT